MSMTTVILLLGLAVAALILRVLKAFLDEAAARFFGREIGAGLPSLRTVLEVAWDNRLRMSLGLREAPAGRRRLPSLSQGLVGLAERRLPVGMTRAEKERWGDEMRADVASSPPLGRLRVAFNAWHKGAPRMLAGEERAPRSAGK